jgi:ABC-type oligopeptide transport system substrate-binding subunit
MRKLLAVVVVLAMVAGFSSCTSAPASSVAPSVAPSEAANPTPESTPTPDLKKLPTMTLVYNTNATHQTVAEAIQQMWKQQLGFDVTLQNLDFPVLIDDREKGNFEIARAGWIGDYADPMTFLDMWITTSGNNDPKYANSEYDALITDAKTTADQAKRMDDMHKAEKMLMDDLPIIPIYYYTQPFCDDGKVTNYFFDPLMSELVFTWATKDGGGPIVYHLGDNPKSLDPALSNDVLGACVLTHCFQGLTAKDVHGQIVPGIASSWDISTDGLTWTFHLRDATWSDGVPVKAQDFVYAWQRAVDPATAAEYAYQLYYIKNAADINGGKADISTLGVKAVDDKTLEVTLEGPCGYFTQITAFPTLFPVRKDIEDKYGDKWCITPKDYVTNGPYVMTKYGLNDEIVLEKNTKFWDIANIVGQTIEMKISNDSAAALAAFEAGEMDFMIQPPPEETQRLIDAGVYKDEATVGTYYYEINLKGDNDILRDLAFRKALSLAIDREAICELTQSGYIPATSYVPPNLPDVNNGDFQKNAGNLLGTSGDYSADCKAARQLLRDAGYEVPED